MIPIVFWASFAPCENEKSAELPSWATRNTRSTRCGDTRRKVQ